VREQTVFNAELVRSKLGLTLQKSQDGFVITDVESNSPAGTAGLQPRMIVQAIDQQAPPDDITGVAKLLYPKKKGSSVILDLAALEQNGNFSMLRRGRVELVVR
jgi:C-terminal processing protease CtpA/Prc